MADTALRPLDRDAPAQRRRFNAADMEAMMRAGVIVEGGPEELLDGEIWLVAEEGALHSRLKVWLNDQLIRRRPLKFMVSCDTTIKFSETHHPSPDFAVFPSRLQVDEARGPDMALVIEISDSSLRDDLKIKGPKYREYGVAEYWVIDAEKRVTHVHLLNGGWPEIPPISFDAELAPSLLPDLRLKLADSGM